jgi:hypothetical protein
MTQEQAFSEFIPYINDVGKIYRKISPVFARSASIGEYIETWTDDGLETTNYAKEGDFVVMNLYTSMKEEYIVSPDMMQARYDFVFDLSEGGIYKPTGKVKAAIYSGGEIQFIAKWGRNMTLKCGDMIVTPLPHCKEVYRIAAKEFYESYILL